MKYFDLTNQVAVVTGGSSGLGVQFAKVLANQGAKIALVARREEKLIEVKASIADEYGVEVEYYTCDVADADKVSEVIDSIEKDFGKIDILVNNAGLGLVYPATDYPVDEWKKMMDINVNGVFYMAQAAGRIMLKNKYGRIINIGSLHSSVVMKDMPVNAYTTTKGAVHMLTKALAVEWAKGGVTVNTIGPAYFESEMTQDVIDTPEFKQILDVYNPMGRAGKEGELDSTLLFLAAKESSYVTGQLITVDGGWTAI